MQSVTDSLKDLYGRVCDLLNKGYTVSGNLDATQVQIQQEGLTQAIQLQQMQIQAGSERARAMKEASDAALEQATLQELQLRLQPVPRYTDTKGFLPEYKW